VDALLPVVVGFLLTTVLGGLLGTYLQWRTWVHQNEVQLREGELRRAGEVCHTVSRLLDKRRYRMVRLFHAVRVRAPEHGAPDLLERRLSDYDQVLYEWNDSLNANLAQMGTSFGQRARDQLERAYERYQQVGAELEEAYRQAARTSQPAALEGLEGRLEELNDTAYQLNLLMLTQLREGTVGRQAPQPLGAGGPGDEPRRARPPRVRWTPRR
jgi:hypothetical protein